MFNPSTSQKSLFEMAQVATNTMREITNANLALANTISDAYFKACTNFCKLGEETSQQATKTTTGSK